MNTKRFFLKIVFTLLICFFFGRILKSDSLIEKKSQFVKTTEQSQSINELIVEKNKSPVTETLVQKTVPEKKVLQVYTQPPTNTVIQHIEIQPSIPIEENFDIPNTPIQLNDLELAIELKDPFIVSDELKKITDKEPDEASKILALVSALEGKHLDLPALIPGIEKQDPIQALLIRKALRHQYMTTKNWLLPIAIQDENLETIQMLEKKLQELEKVNTSIGFM